MPTDPERRLRLRVAIKLLLAVAFAACAVVALGFVFGGAPTDAGSTRRVALAGIAPGEVRTVGYDSRPVIILHRDRVTRESLTADSASHPAWLVVYARGTGQGCPVVWQAERRQFRESCSDVHYDAAGHALQQGYAPLEQPLHRIEDGTVILGRE